MPAVKLSVTRYGKRSEGGGRTRLFNHPLVAPISQIAPRINQAKANHAQLLQWLTNFTPDGLGAVSCSEPAVLDRKPGRRISTSPFGVMAPDAPLVERPRR